jgi:hypothetical protein
MYDNVNAGSKPPPPAYSGIFNVFPANVAGPLVPVVVKVVVFCFEDNCDAIYVLVAF